MSEEVKRVPVERVGALPVDYYRVYIKFELLRDEELTKLGLSEKQLATLKTDQRPDAKFVKQVYLDTEALKANEGLNDAQIAILQTEFTECGLLSNVLPFTDSLKDAHNAFNSFADGLPANEEKSKRARKEPVE